MLVYIVDTPEGAGCGEKVTLHVGTLSYPRAGESLIPTLVPGPFGSSSRGALALALNVG